MNIRVNLNTNIADGSEVVFRSPADCSQVTGLVIYHNGGKTEFAFADAHGNNVGDIDHLFAENAVVKVILDVTASMAFVQNADTNAYIERTFVKSVNGQAPDENGNVDIETSEFIPAGGDPTMEVSFDVAHAQMMTAPEFVITDPEKPAESILLTKEGAEEDEEPRKALMLSDPSGNPVILSNVANPEAETDAANKKFVREQTEELGKYLEDLVFAETIQTYGAKVGQLPKVSAVDDQGHPTAWETVEPPSLGFVLIKEFQLTEDVTSATFSLADNESSEIVVQVKVVAASTNTANGQLRIYFDKPGDIFYFKNAIYKGTTVTSSLYRYSAPSFFTPIFFGDRHGLASDMCSYSRASYTTPVKSVTLLSADSGVLIGEGTVCRVFARRG